MNKNKNFFLAAIIPHYRHEKTLLFVVEKLQEHNLTVFVVDDCSGNTADEVLEQCRVKGVKVIQRNINGGKGAAMKDGIRAAAAENFTNVLQIDADAQHNFDDIAQMIAIARQNPDDLVCANPIYSEDAPRARIVGRKITNFWNLINSCSREIKDGMCGFRIYPLSITMKIIEKYQIGNRMDFDNEILLHFYWNKVKFHWIDSQVKYPADGISHFALFRDNWIISKMHAGLFFISLRQKLGFYERVK
ncbi:MAG: glycosyltransferase family 2 protein [Cardiobacteriaceae bacterium]|nr:glycosyltransferase family 2 protein [Cardiobacteriaceae bacterium]